jgi:hypothetical protein
MLLASSPRIHTLVAKLTGSIGSLNSTTNLDSPLVGEANGTGKKVSKHPIAKPALRLSEKQRWVLAQLASDVKLPRRDIEQRFGISERTVKRVLGELSDVGMIGFDRSKYPGFCRLK